MAAPLPTRPPPDHPRFGRMFPDLPPWDPPGEGEAKQYLSELAESLYRDGAENPDIPAGYTYFGQFINHDVTFDVISSLRSPAQPEQFRSKRTPRFDLDSVYGRGPREQPYLYCRRDPFRLLLGQTESGELDLPRSRDASEDSYGTSRVDRYRAALIGDPRNDDNIILSQLHLAFLRFHNARYDESRRSMAPHDAFEQARKLTRWHYQWVVVHDFLARFCGRELVNSILGNWRPSRRLFESPARAPFVPVEFSLGVFRAGHSIVRPSYHLNDVLELERDGEPIAIFGAPHPKNELGGGRELPEDWSIQWDRFVDRETRGKRKRGRPAGKPAQRSGRVDTHLAPALGELPLRHTSPEERSLAHLTLLKGWRLGLPSGQAVARELGYRPLEPRDRPCEDPLWVYVLREAELEPGKSSAFGEMGSRIAAEVVIAFLLSDPDSFLRRDPGWRPTLRHLGANFELADFLDHAGAPMTAADWDERRQAAGLIRGIAEPVIRRSG